MTTYQKQVQEARDYYALCARAERVGIPTSLDDPDSPRTVAGLALRVDLAESAGAGKHPTLAERIS